MNRFIGGITARPIVLVTGLTILTVGVIGVLIFTITSAGCGWTRSASRCVAQQPVGKVVSPSPSEQPSSSPTEPAVAPVAPTAPTVPPASPPYATIPPYVPPSSSGYPPSWNAASGVPFYLPASAGGPSPRLPRAISCSLPVYTGGPGSGGFITFPGGTFIADPKSNVTLPYPPAGVGFAGLAYDRQYSRWLPVPYRWVSPDGAYYAFPTGYSVDRVVVASGDVLQLGKGFDWQIIDAGKNGVYATKVGEQGLWLLPWESVTTEPSYEITATGYWQAVGGGAAYGSMTAPGNPNVIMRLDLNTGSTTSWFAKPGGESRVVGFDINGSPIIDASYSSPAPNWVPSTSWVVPSPTSPVPLSNGGYPELGVSGSPVADRNGVWTTGSWSGPLIALYIPGSGIYGMSTTKADLASGCS